MILVKLTEDMGRGVYTQHTLPKGQLIMLCELLILSPEDSRKIKDTAFKYYVFEFNENQDCFALGLGALLNHSDTPNVAFRLVEKDNRPMMEFTTLREVQANEQLFINYNADGEVNVPDYMTFKPVMM